MHTPKEGIKIVNEIALNKEGYKVSKTLILAFLAGAYVAFGGLLAIIISGGSPGIAANNPGFAKFLFGAAFPLGLILVVIVGAELFTGNNAYFIPNILTKRQRAYAMLRNWGLVYIGNFVGALFVAYIITYLTHLVADTPYIDMVHKIAKSKTSNTFLVTFIKGIGANWLVCLAIWQGIAAKNTIGKIVAIWIPVMAFVTMGFEHSIANMYFIPLSIFEGADITWSTFFIKNLIPATLGNIVGGALFVGMPYGYLFGKEEN
ncbi:formate/nitrite transporter family protein [Tamlana sp. s12]|uniref:formate/nitrite transporter family protein n=1 Tax=Flavobacteriaceae TaxID=49546 RepID=UPI0007FF0D35|nr:MULTISPECIES: formate/nitrite transporter family protein [Tamlana]OBQ55465.1 formate transporter [Tamlana sp. s12]QQY83873.1 formate/nitrite transporter family protein [Tamlana sp. s12]